MKIQCIDKERSQKNESTKLMSGYTLSSTDIEDFFQFGKKKMNESHLAKFNRK